MARQLDTFAYHVSPLDALIWLSDTSFSIDLPCRSAAERRRYEV